MGEKAEANTTIGDIPLKKVEAKSSSDISPEELEFIKAIDNYKRKFNKPFPTWREVLGILKQLGYRKVKE